MRSEDRAGLGLPAWVVWGLIGLIVVCGLGVRLYDLDDAPLDFHPTRQLHSALIARGMYLENRADVPAWQRELAVQQEQAEGHIEPQVFERFTAIAYGVVGNTDLRIPRVFAIVFWMAGAFFLARLALRWVGLWGVVAALFVYCLMPYAVFASRAFQPDPLMVTLMLATLWAADRWVDAAPSTAWRWTIAAGVLAGAAIYIKAVAVFFVGPALLVAVWQRHGWSAWRDPLAWGLMVLAALPYGLYLVDGVWLSGFLVGQFSERFFPAMWLDPAFYLRWISVMERLMPFGLAAASTAGALWLGNKTARRMTIALWLGYVMYGLALPHHISTHDYYHLPLLMLAALGAAGLAGALMRGLPRENRWMYWLVGAVCIAVIGIQAYQVRNTLKRADYRPEAAELEALGRQLGPDAPMTALVDDYGSALKSYAWQMPMIWPTADDLLWEASQGQARAFTQRFTDEVASRYYFVISPPALLDEQPELAAALAPYPLLVQDDQMLVYDLRSAP